MRKYSTVLAKTKELGGITQTSEFKLTKLVSSNDFGSTTAEWEGHVTLEFSNTTPLPAKVYANEGVAQMIFLESDQICDESYKDRKGKYQGQTGVTLAKT